MKKNIILLGALVISSFAYSQVGINNSAPKATLDITAKNSDGSTAEGIIAPRLTGDQIKSGDLQYDTPQIGTIVYATAAVGTSTPKTVNITSPGYYYFDNNLVWQKFGSGTAAPGTDDWHTTGNAGTNPIATVPATMAATNNYVGTSDAKDFVVGVNGISRGVFNQSGSLIGGAGIVDGLSVNHTFGPTPPVGALIWGYGHQIAVSGGNANLSAVFGNRNTVNSPNGLTTGVQNIIGLNSVASIVSGNGNNLGDYFQNSFVTGRSNTTGYTAAGGNGNIIGGEGNSLSGVAAPKGAIVGGYQNTLSASGNGFLLMGTGNTISGSMFNTAVVGTYNTPVDNSLFIVGNGVSGTTKNAVVVLNSGQVGIGTDVPHSSSILDITSTTQGVLLPRMTTNPAAPADGLIIYRTDLKGFYAWNGVAWTQTVFGASGGTVTNVTGTAPITVATGTSTPVISLANSGVTAGTYTSVTVDAHGLVTAATNPATTEPWFVQTTTTQATTNAQNIYQTGNVSIGSSTPIAAFTSNSVTVTPKLSVTGDVATTGAYYTTTGKYADYVFEDYYDGVSKIDETYKFKSLTETAAYIKANKHLPGVTAIKDILKTDNGYTVNLSELSIQQLEKIEELYLHTIEQQEEISKQKTEINDLKSRMEKLEQLLLKKNNK